MFNARRREKDAGFTTVEWTVCVGFSFLLMVMLVNLIAFEYGSGILRAAADEGARAGARVVADPVESCRARQAQVLSGFGTMATDVTHDCVIVNGQIRATTGATFAGWLPLVPDYHAQQVAVSASEKAQAPQ